MRIDPSTVTVTPVAVSTARDAAAPKPERKDAAAVVTLSSAGSTIETSDADAVKAAEKVAHLRAMIDAGTYHVDLETLAQRIIEDDPFGGSSW